MILDSVVRCFIFAVGFHQPGTLTTGWFGGVSPYSADPLHVVWRGESWKVELDQASPSGSFRGYENIPLLPFYLRIPCNWLASD